MNNEEKKIIGYDPQTGQPIYGGENPQPVATETKKKSNAGLIIGIIVGVIVFLGIVVFAVLALFGVALVGKKTTDPTIVTQEKTFYGESFEINYKSPWAEKEGMLSSGKEQKYLSYNNNEIVLYALGSSDLSKTATQDFSTSTGKFKLYNDFREYWGKTDNISNGTGTFLTLTDGVYYASMDYTRNKTTGKLYIIASEGNNILLTFSTYVNIDKNKADKEVLE